MDNSVYIPLQIGEVEEEEEPTSRTYRLDLDAGRIVGFVDEQEAVRQAIRKAIITPRFKCLIYDNQYGSEIEDAIICNDATRAYIESVTEGFVHDCLSQDTRILDVRNFSFEFQDDAVFITFEADTIFGEIDVEEVL